MKKFKIYLRELAEPNAPLNPNSQEYQQRLAANRAKVDARLASRPITAQEKQQQINSEKRGLESDTKSGREWADKNIDAVQKGTDYATTALGATQVGKPLAAGIQGISSLVDLTQGQHGQAAGRAVGAALTAIPAGELGKVGLKTAQVALDPLKAAVKTGVETVVKTGVPGRIVGGLANTASNSLAQNATAQTIGNIASKVGTKFATDQITSTVKPTVNSGINSTVTALTRNTPTTPTTTLASASYNSPINRPRL